MIRLALLILAAFFVLALIEQGFGWEDVEAGWDRAVAWTAEKLDVA